MGRAGPFLVASLGFLIYSIMSFANSDSLTSSFSIWIPFVSFSSLIAVTRTSLHTDFMVIFSILFQEFV